MNFFSFSFIPELKPLLKLLNRRLFIFKLELLEIVYMNCLNIKIVLGINNHSIKY